MTRNKLTKFIFPLISVLLLAPWPIAYAYDSEGTGTGAVRIQVAEPAAAPSGVVFGRAIGGITPGDLFYIDATAATADIQVTMHITNAAEVSRFLSYLILKVGIYVERNDSQWEKIPIPETFITLQNGKVSFNLAGYARYKIRIDGGNFYAFTTNVKGGIASPQFYLTVQ